VPYKCTFTYLLFTINFASNWDQLLSLHSQLYVTVVDEEYAVHVASAEDVEDSLVGKTQGN